MLPQKRRVIKALFPEVIKKGKNLSRVYISAKIYFVKNNELLKKYGQQSRFSVVIPKTVAKKATDRNLLKRRSHAIIQKNFKSVKDGIWFVVFLRKGAQNLKYKELKNEISGLLGQLF